MAMISGRKSSYPGAARIRVGWLKDNRTKSNRSNSYPYPVMRYQLDERGARLDILPLNRNLFSC